MKRLMAIFGAPLLAVVMTLAALGLLPQGVAAVGEPQSGTVNSIQNYTMLATTAITTDTTTYGGSQHLQHWNSVDLFVTADVSGTATITVTPQVSADDSNWSDAFYTYVANTLAETTSVLTSSGVTTATSTVSSSGTPTDQTYQVVMTADGTEHIRLPMAGRYLRAKVEVAGWLTPTIIAVARNN